MENIIKKKRPPTPPIKKKKERKIERERVRACDGEIFEIAKYDHPDLETVLRYAEKVLGLRNDRWVRRWYNSVAVVGGWKCYTKNTRIRWWHKVLNASITAQNPFSDQDAEEDINKKGQAPAKQTARTWNDCRSCTHYTFKLPQGHVCTCGRTPATCGGAK